MDNFICDNPTLLQDATQFGFKAWIFPLACLLLGCAKLLAVWTDPKFAQANIGSKHHFYLALWGVLMFVGLGHVTLKDQRQKLGALQSGNYSTYQGNLTSIEVQYFRYGIIVNEIRLKISGRVIKPDGQVYLLDRQRRSSQLTTKNALIGVGGKSCSGRQCGLEIGDKVQIKKPYYLSDTLQIEKCTDAN